MSTKDIYRGVWGASREVEQSGTKEKNEKSLELTKKQKSLKVVKIWEVSRNNW